MLHASAEVVVADGADGARRLFCSELCEREFTMVMDGGASARDAK